MIHRWLTSLGSAPILRPLCGLLLLALAVRQWVWSPVLITGTSMQPTWSPGQFAGINKLAYLFSSPRRGDVVFIWTGTDLLVKRVVGLPGEEISARDGAFYINGAPLPERYVQWPGAWNIAPGKLGVGRFVVAGDNRAKTTVSVVRRDRIVGRLVQP